MISFGNKLFNEFLNGGFSNINTFYGKAGTGKTNFCIMAVVEETKQNRRVLYLDSENGVSLDRIQQISGSDFQKVLDNLILLKVSNFRDQHEKIKNLDKLVKNVSLVIVDTMSNHYRVFLRHDKILANNMLNTQMKCLKELIKKGICVIVVNQVFSNVDQKKDEMVGYRVIFPYCEKVVELCKYKERIAYLRKPGLSEFKFEIVDEGIKHT